MARNAIRYLDYTDRSNPTTDLLDTEAFCEGQRFLALEFQGPLYRPYRPTMISPPGGLKPAKPGLIDSRRGPRSQTPPDNNPEGLVWHHCYGHHYLAVEFPRPARQLPRVVSNYESLTNAERARVLVNAY